MGVGNNTGGRKTFLNIKEGKIALKNKAGQIELFDHVNGTLTDVAIVDGQFGRELHLTLHDNPDTFLLQMKFDSGYAKAFMKTIQNADLNQPITLMPKYEEADGKKKSSMFVSQHGKALKWVYTTANPGGMPLLQKLTVRGQEVWDNTEQMKFLERILMEEVKPKLPHPAVAAAERGEPVEAKLKPETQPIEEMEEDDLPF